MGLVDVDFADVIENVSGLIMPLRHLEVGPPAVVVITMHLTPDGARVERKLAMFLWA